MSLQVLSKKSEAKIASEAIMGKPFSMAYVCEAIGQITVGHQLDMLALDQKAHGKIKKGKDKDEDEDEDDNKK